MVGGGPAGPRIESRRVFKDGLLRTLRLLADGNAKRGINTENVKQCISHIASIKNIFIRSNLVSLLLIHLF